MKTCSKCKKKKSLSKFFKDSQKKDGLRPDCKECSLKRRKAYQKNNREKCNWANTKWRTGIDRKTYLSILKKQKNRCAICGEIMNGNNIKFSIDHNHESMLIRGLLCSGCNKGLGQFKDNPEVLKNAIKYLKKNLSHKKEITYGKKN